LTSLATDSTATGFSVYASVLAAGVASTLASSTLGVAYNYTYSVAF